MKKIWDSYRSSFILLGCMILGGIVGAFWGPGASVLAPWANIFLNLLYCCVVPMIFISLVYAIASMDNMRKLGKVLAVLLVLFLITGVVCSAYMVGFTALFDPAKNTDMTQFAQESVDLSGTSLDILAMFTVSDFSLLWSRTNLMALVVYAILTGIAVVMAGEKAKPVIALLEGLNEVMVKLVGIVMKLAPLGLGFYFAILIGTNGRDIVGPLSRSFLTYVVAILIYYFAGHSIMAYLGGGRKAVGLYWKNNVTPSLTALGTCSTAATLPYNMIAGKKMGLPKDMSDLCVLMGANLHKDGASILQVLQATFVCALCGIDVFTPKNIVLLIVAAIVGSTIMGAIPGGGYVGQLVIASIFGLPNWTIPIMALIVTLGDPFATLVNVTGDTALGMIAARIVNGRDWLERSLEEYAQDEETVSAAQ